MVIAGATKTSAGGVIAGLISLIVLCWLIWRTLRFAYVRIRGQEGGFLPPWMRRSGSAPTEGAPSLPASPTPTEPATTAPSATAVVVTSADRKAERRQAKADKAADRQARNVEKRRQRRRRYAASNKYPELLYKQDREAALRLLQQFTSGDGGALSFEDEEKLDQELQRRELTTTDEMGLPLAEAIVLGQIRDGRLPREEHPTFVAKPDETVHLETPAAFLKTVVDREYRGGYGGVSVRVAKGVSVRTGGMRGHSVAVGSHNEVADSGILAVTSTRVVFIGAHKTLEHQYGKLVQLKREGTNLLYLGVSNRQSVTPLAVVVPTATYELIRAAMERGRFTTRRSA